MTSFAELETQNDVVNSSMSNINTEPTGEYINRESAGRGMPSNLPSFAEHLQERSDDVASAKAAMPDQDRYNTYASLFELFLKL